ncbi:hypothetical protein GCM10023222_55330 [Saccharopolyspora cebuensis]
MPTTPRTHHRHRSRTAFLLMVVLCAVLAAAHGASAETTHVVAVASLDQVLTNIRNWIMGMLALVATVFLTIGGVRYLLANGDPGEVEKAKSALRNAAFGYMLAALAPVIVDILRGLVGA